MFKIHTKSGEFLTEKPNYIRRNRNGSFVLTDQEYAEGVAYNGTPYLFEDGVIVTEVDVGADLLESKETEALTLETILDQGIKIAELEIGL